MAITHTGASSSFGARITIQNPDLQSDLLYRELGRTTAVGQQLLLGTAKGKRLLVTNIAENSVRIRSVSQLPKANRGAAPLWRKAITLLKRATKRSTSTCSPAVALLCTEVSTQEPDESDGKVMVAGDQIIGCAGLSGLSFDFAPKSTSTPSSKTQTPKLFAPATREHHALAGWA